MAPVALPCFALTWQQRCCWRHAAASYFFLLANIDTPYANAPGAQ
jgi:hypothetical protein